MKKNVWFYVIVVYMVCYIFRMLEYFGIRTDQTIIGEAFIHKIIGIFIMVIAVKQLHYRFEDIGIKRKGIIRYTIYGLLSGVAAFAIGYGTEIIICMIQGNFTDLSFYVSSYAIDKNIALEQGGIFLLICIIGNVLNVIMEESIFRGLFQKLFMNHYSFVLAATISSVLFGFWHIIGPIRNYIDGTSSLNGAIANVIMLFISSGLIGFKFSMMSKLEGALYMGMADHFVNNVIVNLLHVTTSSDTDELMFLRITVAQTLSFIVVLVIFLKRKTKKVEK